MNEPLYASIPECSRFTGVSKDYLYHLVHLGKIPYLKIGKKFLLNRQELLEHLQRMAEAEGR